MKKTPARKVAPAKGRMETQKITIPAIDIKMVTIILESDSPLITHRFSSKAKQGMLDRQQKKARQGRPIRDPKQEYLDSMYYLKDEKTPAFPGGAFKDAAVSACRFADGMKMTTTRGAFHVMDDLVKIEGKPRMREDTVRLQGRGSPADLRYRAEFPKWKVTLTIRYNAGAISVEQITNLLNIAGFGVGIGEWRPEKRGSFGMFHVKTR